MRKDRLFHFRATEINKSRSYRYVANVNETSAKVVSVYANKKIGEVAGDKLAEMSARIVLVARERSRGEGTLARLREKALGLAHTVHYAGSEMKWVEGGGRHSGPTIFIWNRKRGPQKLRQ